jgi:DNA-binding MarR family transcriptional regulator
MNDRTVDKEADNAIFRFFNEIGIIAQLSGHLLESILPHELKMAHFSVLNHLARLGGAPTPVELARAMQVTKGAMTNTVGRLERRGYVSVTPDPHDGRAKRVQITDAGLSVRNEAIAAIMPVVMDLAKNVSAPDMIETLPLLEKVRGYLDINRP